LPGIPKIRYNRSDITADALLAASIIISNSKRLSAGAKVDCTKNT